MRSGRARCGLPALWLALAVLAAQGTWLSYALAQGGDVVMLTNGGRLRGTVEVYEPGADLVIVLADGTRRTVPAADVAQVIFADAAPSATPPAGGTTPTPPVETPLPPPTPPAGTTSPGPAILAPMPPPPSSGPAPMVIPPSSTPADPRRGDRRGGAPSGDGYGLGEAQSLEAIGTDSAGIPEGAVREYAADRLSSSPWTEDAARQGLPLGMFHVGVELRGAMRLGAAYYLGSFEVATNLIFRLAPWFHVRVAAVVAAAGGSRGPGGALGLRALLAFDLARLFSVRLGGVVIGGDWFPARGDATFYGGPELDIVGQLTDEGRLEMGVAVSVPLVESEFWGPAIVPAWQVEIITGVIL